MEKQMISSSGGLKNIRISETKTQTVSFRIEKYQVWDEVQVLLTVDEAEKWLNFQIPWTSVGEVEKKMIEKVQEVLK